MGPQSKDRGGAKRGGGGKSKYGGQNYTSKRQVGGRGVYVTCVRGKERGCAAEMCDLLQEVASKLYPAERLAALAAVAAELAAQYAALRALNAANAGEAPVESVESVEVDGDEEEESSDEDLDESIEASIARELAELKSARSSKMAPVKAGEKGKGKERERAARPPFISVFTGVDCLVFISIARPYDPVELCEAIMCDVRDTGLSQTKYTNRLEPVSVGCHSLTLSHVKLVSDDLIRTEFYRWAQANNTTTVTYSISPSIRLHQAPLNRDVVIETVGSSVRSLAIALPLDTSTDSTAPPPLAPLTVSANLKSPDLVILPVVFKNAYGIGIVDGKLWCSDGAKKYNVDAASAFARRRLADIEGVTHVRGMEGIVKPTEVVEKADAVME